VETEGRRGQTSFACFSFLSFFRGGSATGTAGGGVGGGGEASGGRAPCETCWRTDGKKADSDANMKDGGRPTKWAYVVDHVRIRKVFTTLAATAAAG